MEMYVRVARKGTKASPVRVVLTEPEFNNALWVEANDLAWNDMKDMENYTYEQQQAHCDAYLDALKYASHTIKTEYGIEGGVMIRDYMYHTITDDTIDEYDIPRRN